MRNYKLLALFVALLTFSTIPDSFAKDGKDKGKHDWKHDDSRHDNDSRRDHKDKDHKKVIKHVEHRNYYIPSNNRVVIKRYYRSRWNCPPGLVKKRNGCTPPGRYVRYNRYDYIPTNVYLQPVPRTVLYQLEPAPIGTNYVMYNNSEIYLVDEISRLILDSINLY